MYSNPDSSVILFLDERLAFVHEFNSGRIVSPAGSLFRSLAWRSSSLDAVKEDC